jgi:RNA polymerase-binding transcription factor DksA
VNDTPEPSAGASPTDKAVEQSPSDAAERPPADLDRIERDLAGVETALQRLDAGTYWTDEATGEPIPDEALAADPVARRTP